jgi:hypothetical protein
MLLYRNAGRQTQSNTLIPASPAMASIKEVCLDLTGGLMILIMSISYAGFFSSNLWPFQATLTASLKMRCFEDA